MIIRKGYKYALRTTPKQRAALRCFVDGCNAAYNRGLAIQHSTYKYYQEYVVSCGNDEAKKNGVYGKISKYGLIKMLTTWRKADDEEGVLFRKTPAAALQQTLLDLDRAYTCFFKGLSRPPAMKLQGNYGSFRVVQMTVSQEGINLHDHDMGYIQIPKLGKIYFYLSRQWIGTPRNATISVQGDRWFVSIQTEVDDGVIESSLPLNPKVIGIDIGLAPFLTLSNGEEYFAPMPYEKELKRIQALQKDLKRSTKGSENYKKKLLRFDKLHITIRNIRRDWLHKITTQLAKQYDVIYIPEIYVTKWDKPKRSNTNVVTRSAEAKGKKTKNTSLLTDDTNGKKTKLNNYANLQPTEDYQLGLLTNEPINQNTNTNNDVDYENANSQPKVDYQKKGYQHDDQHPQTQLVSTTNICNVSNETRRKLRDVGIDEFERQLTYKMREQYKDLIIVPIIENGFDREKSCIEKAKLLLPIAACAS